MARRQLPGLLAALAALLLAVAAAAGDDGFFPSVSDLPLMPGLNEIEAATTVFDKPGGRIVEAYAEGSARPQAVWRFYDRTLPQLGWQRRSEGRFARDGERLTIEVKTVEAEATEAKSTETNGTGPTLTVRFSIAPQ